MVGWAFSSIAVSPDGARLYGVVAEWGKIVCLDPASGAILAELAGAGQPAATASAATPTGAARSASPGPPATPPPAGTPATPATPPASPSAPGSPAAAQPVGDWVRFGFDPARSGVNPGETRITPATV